MNFRNVIYLIMLLTGRISAQDDPVFLKFSGNYRLYPSQINQTEVFIVTSPLNQDILFASCNTLNFIPFFISEGIFVTTDGGGNWQGNDTCTGSPIDFHGGDPGIAIDKEGTFILTRLGRSPFTGLYSHYSTDNGATWSAQQVISTDDLERASVISDPGPGSAFYGRTYAAWVRFAPPFPLMFAYTDDGAHSWTTPVAVNNPSNRSAGGDLAGGPGGEVYVCWAGVTATTPFREILVGFASSHTGGVSWDVTEQAFPVSGITGVLPNKDNIRVNGLPNMDVDLTDGPRRGWIYIVTGQKDLPPAGIDPDVILNRSTDGGLTWSAGIRVNQDPLNNGKEQYFPTVHIDRFGGVNVIFYDDRHTTSDSAGVTLARSTDGGDTWNEYELSDHNFKPTPIGGLGQGYQGDNIDITSTDSTLWPVWMDNSTGVYQIWTAPVAFSSLQGMEDPATGPEFSIYPNPLVQGSRFKVQGSRFKGQGSREESPVGTRHASSKVQGLREESPVGTRHASSKGQGSRLREAKFYRTGFKNPLSPVTSHQSPVTIPQSPFTGHSSGSLKLFDLFGKEVATLFRGEVPAVGFTWEFDLEEANGGKGITPGIYLVRLTVDGRPATKKLVYLK